MISDQTGLERGDNILIPEVHRGFSYQLAAALTRLGRKVVGLIEDASIAQSLTVLNARYLKYHFRESQDWNAHPLLSFDYTINAFVLSFHNSLTEGKIPSPEEWKNALELCKALSASSKNPQFIGIFPQNFSQNSLEEFYSISPQTTTLFLTPLVFGFRDEFLFDYLFEIPTNERIQLGKKLKNAQPQELPFVFVGDLVGFILSTLGDQKYFGKVVNVPATFKSPLEFANEFLKSNAEELSAFDRLKNLSHFLQKNPLSDFLDRRLASLKFSQNLGLHEDGRSIAKALPRANEALEIFPTLLSSPERIFQSSRGQHERDPLLKSHFPPGRAL